MVASEVRTLAQCSASAAKEIKGLIEDSVAKVAQGSALVDQAGQTMSEIVSSVERVSNVIGEISAASQEQASGIEQVNQAVSQMDETTQQNAALVEEATAAARSMEDQSVQLATAVAVFKVNERAQGKPATASASLAKPGAVDGSRLSQTAYAGKPTRRRHCQLVPHGRYLRTQRTGRSSNRPSKASANAWSLAGHG